MSCKFLKLNNIVFLFFLVSINFPTWANMEQVQQCTVIKANAKRLECFDKLFNTPIRTQTIDEQPGNTVIPRVVSEIFTLSETMKESRKDGVYNEDQGDSLQVAVNSEKDAQAAIYITCKDNITRFQMALKNPITRNPVNVEIRDDLTQKLVSKINWQSAEYGYLLDSGRGLFAIQQLKQILYVESFSIFIPEEKRSFTFKNNGLAADVASIRKECGW